MLTIILYTLFILACLALILSVLLQPGKADAGALFTSSVSSTAFGPRGTQTILAKITIAAAITFMLVALVISMGIGGQRSVISPGETGPAPAASPAAQTEASPAADTGQPQGSTPAGEGAAPTASPATSDSPQPAATPEGSK